MNNVVVLNVVALSKSVIDAHMPFIQSLAQSNTTLVKPVTPAVTTSAQYTYLTGKYPADHGIVANGWLFRDEMEVKLWRQSNRLVQAAKIWETAKKRNDKFTCANIFWWYNMFSEVDYAVTPRPQYKADGKKIFDILTHPQPLRDDLKSAIGEFPFFSFWGPMTSIAASKWIAGAAKSVYEQYRPHLSLVYLPHLDYCLQKYDHDSKEVLKDKAEMDELVKDTVRWYESKGAKVILLSEYGITPVSRFVPINKILREKGYLKVTTQDAREELLDTGSSIAFAMADHQIAHIYINRSEYLPEIKKVLESTKGIAKVLDENGKKEYKINHERAGELVCISDPDAWFSYQYWLDDQFAPDFARTIDIHRKPGYDPLEMFIDRKNAWTMPRLALKKLASTIGFRTLFDITPLDNRLIKGSHGSPHVGEQYFPVLIQPGKYHGNMVEAHKVHELILNAVFER